MTTVKCPFKKNSNTGEGMDGSFLIFSSLSVISLLTFVISSSEERVILVISLYVCVPHPVICRLDFLFPVFIRHIAYGNGFSL